MSEARNVLVTGATRGIGRAMAQRFVQLGHALAGCGRDGAALESLANELGPAARLHAVDVTDEASVASWASTLEATGWVPDLLINNAGVINRQVPLWELEAAEFRRVLDVNVVGVFHVIHAFLPAMIERGRGVIVNMSSGWGKSTSPRVAAYCASKFAVEGMTRALAQELPEGLAAVPLSPGVIHTEMLETAFGDQAASHWKPEEWAEPAVDYLLQLGPADNGSSQRIPES
ncbi:MAG: SDR family oxidoreductase [Acidobacteriota bacterium]